jgi:A/G-specific adenine glycosylase
MMAAMPSFAPFDARGYRTVDVRSGYAEWAAGYEPTVVDELDLRLLEDLDVPAWAGVRRAADLGCGTGRTGAWLRAAGVPAVDGVDLTPEMLAAARERGAHDRLVEADVTDTGLDGGAYDLVVCCLVDEHLEDLGPLYAEAARLAAPGGLFVLVGLHPQFFMVSGMPTHYTATSGESVAITTHVHLLSDHVAAAHGAGWTLAELRESVVDDRWVAAKPKWERLRGNPGVQGLHLARLRRHTGRAMDVDALLAWYARVRRPLPWRFTRDPYALLVSEVMLQQTQAARVVPFYEAFLAEFPTVEALAAAPPHAVLSRWSGLGYNRRALALRAAAAEVAARGWPDDLRELPGVGPYTAAAVAAFAWDAPAAAVDTNVRRVIARHDGEDRSPPALAARATELLARHPPAAFNQATMELGATVCTPRRPRCEACPVATTCASADGVAVPARRSADGPRERFEDSDRWLRGRIVAARLAGAPDPEGVEPARLARVLAGLERDGLLEAARRG